MALPLKPPVKPQLALSRKQLPEGEEWAYEPKWDGFRAIVFVDGDDVYVQSRNGKPLSRYFPELTMPSGRYVADGELVILGKDGHEQFDALQQRIHPAESRVRMLAEETPVRFQVFDLLAANRKKLLGEPFAKRRDALEALVVGWRPGKAEGTVGSLILGLYDDSGELHVVGHTSSFKAKEKRELRAKLAPYETGERGSGDPSRWDAGRELEWISLRPELVATSFLLV